MKIIYLINSKEYNYHKSLAKDFVSVTGGEVIDMGDGTNLGIRYYQIEDITPDVIITFDLAGHALRTGNDMLSLNNVYARFAHILFHKPDHYGRALKARQNLSMFTYIPNGQDVDAAKAVFAEAPNINEFVPVIYKSPNDKERSDNIENIKRWWDDFRREAML